MAKRQYRWFSQGLWQSQSGNAILALLNPLGSDKKVTVNRVEVFNNKHYGTFPTVDVVVDSTTRTDGDLGGERVNVVSMDTSASLPSGITLRRNTSIIFSNTSFLRLYTLRLTTTSAFYSSAYGPSKTRMRKNGRSGWHFESWAMDNMDPITINPGEFLAITNLNTGANQESIPLEVQLRFNVNNHTFATVFPCFVGFNGTAAFVLLNQSTSIVYIKRLFLREVGTADTPYFQLVPVGAIDPNSIDDQWRRAYGQPLDSQYGGYQSGDPYFVLDAPMLPYLVPHQYLADGSAGSPKGVNYLHTKDFWGPTYGVFFPEFATIHSTTACHGLCWPLAYRYFLNLSLVLREGEGLAMVSSAETAVIASAIGTSGWQPYEFCVTYSVEPKSIPTIKATGMVPGTRWVIQKKATNQLVQQEVTTDGTMEYTYYEEDIPLEMVFKARKASESPYYKPFEVSFLLTADGITIPVSQVKDE